VAGEATEGRSWLQNKHFAISPQNASLTKLPWQPCPKVKALPKGFHNSIKIA
jgi:hypothetical protein